MPAIAPVVVTAPGADAFEFAPIDRPSVKQDAPDWVVEGPPSSTQRPSKREELDVNPCMTPDPGFGNYYEWDRSPSIGQMIVPKNLKLDDDGRFPVVIHFHGHEAARKEWVQTIDDAVLVGIDLGLNSGPYLKKFADRYQFGALLESIEAGVSQRIDEEAKIGKLGISSWSAGYGAVERVLRSEFAEQVDAVMMFDGLHSGSPGSTAGRRTLEPFAQFAELAATGDKMMFVSHSSIVPPGYASTTETANYLIWQMGGQPEIAVARGSDPMGLDLISEYDRGYFHVRGYSGNGPLDHCAQVGLYRQVLTRWLAPRWRLTTVD
jgi:hypothetical protein